MLHAGDSESMHLPYGGGNILTIPVKPMKYRYDATPFSISTSCFNINRNNSVI